MLELLEWLTDRSISYGLTTKRNGECTAMVEGFEDCGTHHIPFNALMCALMKYLKHNYTQESENEHNTNTHPSATVHSFPTNKS